jgi:hypothetical protein
MRALLLVKGREEMGERRIVAALLLACSMRVLLVDFGGEKIVGW